MSAWKELKALYVDAAGGVRSLRDGSLIYPKDWARAAEEKRIKFGVRHCPREHSLTCLISLGFWEDILAAAIMVGLEAGFAAVEQDLDRPFSDPWVDAAATLARSWAKQGGHL
jgi:hypothetical protein